MLSIERHRIFFIAVLLGHCALGGICMALDQPIYTSFTTPITYEIGGFHSNPVVMADFNSDGKTDIAATITYSGFEGVWIMLGNGDGSFQPAIRRSARGDSSYFSDSATVGDFNLDGKPDIVVGTQNFYGTNGSVSILLGNGDGSFQLKTDYNLSYSDNFIYSYNRIVIGDFNKDGKPDLAIENSNNGSYGSYTVSIYLGNGDGSFRSAAGYSGSWLNEAHSLAVADFNGDSLPDLVVICNEKTLILQGNGDGTFSYYYTVYTDYGTRVTVGDFNNDNKIDLATGHVSILLGNGDFTFQSAINYYDAPNGITSISTGNFNGDNYMDLAISNYNGWDGYVSRYDQGVSILLGNGDGSFQPRQFYYTPANSANSVVVGDIDSNGKPDLAVAHDIGAFSIMLNTTYIRHDVVYLFLHGLNSNPDIWNTLTQEIFPDPNQCPAISLKTSQATFPATGCYRYKFRTNRVNNDIWANGDGSTFTSLGSELKIAIKKIQYTVNPKAIILIGHSRGGLAARAFLQSDALPQPIHYGLLTIGTPHLGSPFGRVKHWLDSNGYTPDDQLLYPNKLRFIYSPSVGYLATDNDSDGKLIFSNISSSIWNLNKKNSIKTLVNNVSVFGEIASYGIKLGEYPILNENINLVNFGLNVSALPGDANDLKSFVFKNITNGWKNNSDGIVPFKSQIIAGLPYFHLNGKPIFTEWVKQVHHVDEIDEEKGAIKNILDKMKQKLSEM